MTLAIRHAALVLTAALFGAGMASAQGLNLIPGVQELPSDTIGDVALATVDLPQPAIFYNPVLIRRYGPVLARFFIAHEYGHIYHRHTRAGLVDLPDETRDSILRSQELEADCYAAGQPDEPGRAATEAALRFFSRLGPFRFDAVHPTGSQRTARILMCLPGPRASGLYGRGETGVEMGPVSGEPDLVQFEVLAADLGTGTFGSSAELWLDGLRVGSVSNMRLAEPLRIARFGAGIHNYRLILEVFRRDTELQYTASGSVLGRGQVLLQDGDRFRVDWVPGASPTLVREASKARLNSTEPY